MTKYKDILKIEFKDSIQHFSKGGKWFHLYRINRLLTNGSLISFDYKYLPHDDPNVILSQIDLGDYGVLVFEIDIRTSYGFIVTEGYEEIINNFLNSYDVFTELKKA